MSTLRSPHDRDILRLAVPALGSLIAEPLYVLTDTAIVGHLGTDQLAGLAIAAAILLTIHALSIFLAYGTTATVGRLLGAGDHEGAAHTGVQGLWLGAAVGGLVAVIVAVAAEPLTSLFDPTPAVQEFALTYLRISLIGVPAILMVLAGTGYLRGLQDTTTPLIVAIGTAVLNLVVEVVLVYPLDLGVAGSAWSTVIAQVVGASVYASVIWRAARRRGAGIGPDPRTLWSMARFGGPLVVRTAALRGSLVAAAAIAGGIGTVELAAHQVAMEIWGLLALALDAVAIAGQALVARLLGSGSADHAREAAARMIQLSVFLGVVLLVVLLAASPIAPAVFTADTDVRSVLIFLLVIVAALQPLNAVVFALDGILIGAGDLRYLARAMLLASAVFALAATPVVAADLGVGWLWFAIGLFTAARAIPLAHRFRQGSWLVTGT